MAKQEDAVLHLSYSRLATCAAVALIRATEHLT